MTMSTTLCFLLCAAAPQEPKAPTQGPARNPSPVDASAGYRASAEALRTTFGADLARLPDEEALPDGSANAEVLVTKAWRDAVAGAGPALAPWRAALAHDRCRFDRIGKEPPGTEFFDLFLPIVVIKRLAGAAAEQALQDGRTDDVAGAVRGLLAMARHLHAEPTTLAWGVAAGCELHVADLLRRAAAKGDAVAPPVRTLVQQHLAARAPIAQLATAVQEEATRTLAVMLRAMQAEVGPNGEAARRFAAEVRRLGQERIAAYVAPLARHAGPPTDEFRRALGEHAAAVAKDLEATKARIADLKKRAAGAGAQPTAAADLAVLLWGLCTPPLEGAYDQQADALRKLLDVAGR